jgi:hypothetical protein
MLAPNGPNSIAAATLARCGTQNFVGRGGKTMRRILLAMVLALAVPSAASALVISADADTGDCFSTGDDCVGGLYEITLVEGLDDEYTATITANYNIILPGGDYDLDIGENALSGVWITHVEIKVANIYVDPIASPDGSIEDGPLSAGGCDVQSNEGKLCLELTSPDEATGILSWTMTFGAIDLLAEEDWHLGIRFEWDDGKGQDPNNSLLSAHAAPVPEPTSAILFALGGVLVVGAQKRRV